MVVCAVSISPLPGLTFPGFASRYAAEVALHLTVVKLTCNENGVQTYSSWYAPTHSQEDYHGPHNDILPQ
jgi:ribosomal protein S12 methylthiotransferase accessory factor YcaO